MAVATVIPTGQRVHSWGSLKMETGQFTQAATTVDDILINTKLRTILHFEVVGATVENCDVKVTWNSSDGSNTVPGSVFIDKGIADGIFNYAAYGKG